MFFEASVIYKELWLVLRIEVGRRDFYYYGNCTVGKGRAGKLSTNTYDDKVLL